MPRGGENLNIFALWGEIEINRQKAESDIVAVEKQAEKSGKKMESSFDKVTKVVATAIKEIDKYGDKVEKFGKNLTKKVAVPLAGLTALMGGLAKKTADYGDQMAKASQEVGMNVVAYQELTYVLGQNNLGAEESLRVFGRLNQRIGLARKGNENYRKSLERMGVSMDALDDGLIGTEEAFEHIIEYLSGMEDSQLQAAYASDIFGTMLSRKMMPLIRSGSEGVAELRDRARELGIVLDEEFAERSEVFGDTMDDLKQTASGLSRAFGKELLAPLINIGRVVTDVIAGMSRWVSENPKLVRQIIMWGGAIAGVLGVLVTLGTTLVVTGKIIGALGAVFNILTSKPLLIIAAIGALYLAWESDWLGIRTAVEDAWAIISPVIDAIIEWGHQTISTVWNWTTEATSKFLTWVSETAWPWIGGTVSTAWNWTTGKVGEFIAWIKDTAWPTVEGGASTAWSWTTGVVNTFVTWIKDVAWPFIGGTASTAWDWSKGHWDSFVMWLYGQWGFIVNGLTSVWSWSMGYVDKFVTWIKDVAWPVISGGAKTAWDWSMGKVDDFVTWIKDTAWPWINGTVKTTWDWTVKGLDWLKDLLGIGGKKSEVEVPGGLGGGGGGARGGGTLTKLEKQALIVAEVMKQGGTVEQAMAILGIGYWETRGAGGYAHTDPTTGDVTRGGAGEYGLGQVMPGTGKDVWTRLWKQPAETYDEEMLKDLDTNIAMMVSYFLDRYNVHGEDLRLAIEGYNRGTAIDGLQAYTVGVVDWMEGAEGQGLAGALYDGMTNALEAWVQAGYDMDGDVRDMAEFIAQSVADYLVGQSPPPEGPLADIDEGGANVMGAWVEGAEDGLKDGVPKLTGALENIKNLFGTIWGKVPEEIRGPIEQAMTWMTDLIGQAEEALFKLDDFQNELNALMGGDGSPGDEAQGFMARLAKALDEKLEALDDPLTRFVDAVSGAALHLTEVVRAISSGNWAAAFLSILMETESFAKAMELIGAVLAPVVALFDLVLAPIINGILRLWNAIIDGLASISIFGWKPFKGLADKKITLVGEDDGSSGGGSDRGSGGRQVSEITGPTRDLLVDLLSPLANFGNLIGIGNRIYEILDARLPDFGAFSMDFAGAGFGGVVFESGAIVIHSGATNATELTKDMVDEIDRELGRRQAARQRGRGGR